MKDYQSLIGLLNKKRFKSSFFEDSESAKAHVMELIRDCDTIGFGGSMTLNETGIFDAVINSGKQVYATVLEKQKANPDIPETWKNATFSDCFITSTNALTTQGDLVNIDANGNRVGPMFFGPKSVIVVCGVNKIVEDPMQAVARIQSTAAPKNTVRLGLATPCAVTGKCEDCSSPQRICNVVVRIQYPPRPIDIHIVLINEELGY